MKFGPFTFQCACLQCNCRSTASARHALHSSMSWTRFVSDKSIPVAYILVLVLSSLARPSCSQNSKTRLHLPALLSDNSLLFNDGLYRPDQFHAALGIEHTVDESCRCSGDPV